MKSERIDALRARYRDEALRRGVNPRDVDLLLADLTRRSAAWVIAHGEVLVDADDFAARMERRFAGEPLQYIRGKTEFYSREFFVDSRVLIPRPETEVLVEAAIERIPRGARVVDVGAGSGCISVTLALEREDLRVAAVDRSVDALAVATRNRNAYGANVALIASDVLTAIRGNVDAIVSNPPYIAAADVEGLAVEVRAHEPRMALTPGPVGTEIIERMLDEPHGAKLVLMEIGYGQEELIRELAQRKRWRVDALLNDLAAIPRVVVLSPHAE